MVLVLSSKKDIMLKFLVFLHLFFLETHCFVQIIWSRPKVMETLPGNFENFANTAEDWRKMRRRIYFDACHIRTGDSSSIVARAEVRNHWLIFALPNFPSQSEMSIYEEISKNCKWEWSAPREGNYTVQLQIENLDNKTLGQIRTDFFVKDIWFVSMGDSYPSGQGNPDVPAQLFGIIPAKWIDPTCYRSGKAFSYMTYEKILQKYPGYGILFTYLACSGASILKGLLGDCFGCKHPQLTIFESILNESRRDCSYHCLRNFTRGFCNCKYGPDAILLGVGGNDIGYGELAANMFLGNPYKDLFAMAKRMETLSNRMQQLHGRFLEMDVEPKSIFYAEYFDLLRDDYGMIDATCKHTGLATTFDFYLADNAVRRPINNLITAICQQCGWTKIDGIDEMFSRHGICARNSFIRNLVESLAVQGDMIGAFHPNHKGHKAVAELVWNKVEPHLESKLGNTEKKSITFQWNGYFYKFF